MYSIFDIETDGLLHEVTKIHCISFILLDKNLVIQDKFTVTDSFDSIFDYLKDTILVGHNILRYDLPVITKLLHIQIPNKVIDTLALSWYLEPDRYKHGLESYGEQFSVEKPAIADWNNLSLQDYTYRCEQDCEINYLLFKEQMPYLNSLYEGETNRIIGYLNFKMLCLQKQEQEGILIDNDLLSRTKTALEEEINSKSEILIKAMPSDIGKVMQKKPSKITDKNGVMTKKALAWYTELHERNLPMDSSVIYEEPNPHSSMQVKKWLTSLNWKPETFTVSKATKERIPQVSLPFGAGICPSVKALYTVEPALQNLEGFYMLYHRLGILKSFEERQINSRVQATAHGLTNTLRFTHSVPCVNLPSVTKPYGTEIRGLFIAPNPDFVCFGADVSALEDTTKQHYIYFFDPKYVNDMRVPGFDPHTDMAVLASLMTKQEEQTFKDLQERSQPSLEEIKELKRLKAIRAVAKTCNFACVYGASPAKIAETAKIPLQQAEQIHKAYWKRNKAVKSTAASVTIKTVRKQNWLLNPVSGFFYHLKDKKDAFSTLNQGTGSYVFDIWLRNAMQPLKDAGAKVLLQYHDEVFGICPRTSTEEVKSIFITAMDLTSKEINLNVPLLNSISFGNSYADCH